MTKDNIFRLEKNIMPAYVSGSRDFQMLCRLMTFIIGAGRNSADQLKYLNDSQKINDRLLNLLSNKVGFIQNKKFTNNQIRDVVSGFHELIKIKGTEDAIYKAIYLFFNALNIDGIAKVNIVSYNDNENDSYRVQVGIQSVVKDFSLLYELLKFVVPIGYYIDIFFFTFVIPNMENYVFIDDCTLQSKIENERILIFNYGTGDSWDKSRINMIPIIHSEYSIHRLGEFILGLDKLS